MKPPSGGPPSLSRRTLLGGVAGLATTQAVPVAAAETPALTVMTRNLYLGIDLSRLFRAESMDDVRRIAGQMLTEIRSHPFAARADAIAAEVANTEPDVIGLQEAAVLRVQAESDFSENPSPNAASVVVDLLELLSSKLAARGLEYEVVSSTVTTDIEVPADDEDGQADVRLTDRDAVLVRSDLEASANESDTFDASLEYWLRQTSVSIQRGYCLVDVTVDGVDVTVATTHLESADGDTRQDQARELLDLLPQDRPVVLTGDFNSGPGGPSDAYDLLTDSFDDAHSSLRPDADAPTCCQASDLRNSESAFSRRVDHVLYRGEVRPTTVERVGADPESMVTADVDGESVRMWPSDHAGVVSTLELTASTPTPTATSTPSPTATAVTTSSDPDPKDSSNVPLYGTAAGAGSAALAALVWYRKHR